ncbi:MAG: GAF domain-containing sensor histidine kinase, partial [Kineosporiaceae bacterium]
MTEVETRRSTLTTATRAGLLLLGALLAAMGGELEKDAGALAALVVIAGLSTIPLRSERLRRTQPVLEALLASCVIVSVEPLPEPLLPYLLAPALAGGLMAGFAVGVAATGLATLVLVVAPYVTDETLPLATYFGTVGQWTLIALAVALLGGWVRRLQSEHRPENAAYAAAYRLLSQLRLVSRQLSGGLDPVTLAQGLLEHLHRSAAFDRAAVYVRSAGGRLVPVTFRGAERLDWRVDGPVFDEAWASAEPVRQDAALTPGMDGHSALIPLRIGLRTFGLVAVERTGPPFDPHQLRQASAVVEEQALRLETALLFSEVRTLATAEERRRLAREIHDGIAQELASLGYVVDDLAARARFLPDLERDLRALRGELTRVITELRLSIFDLRSDVQSTVGLGAALSDYARQVGAGSNLVVHLVLNESPVRLPVDAETELLRIAQEA